MVARSPFAIILVPVGVWSLLHVASKLVLLASRVAVSDSGIAARTYLGGSREMSWMNVTAVEKFENRTFDYRTLVRVRDGTFGGSFTFTDAIEDFSELTALIKTKAPAAREARMPLIWRVILV
jgi:hypothetical protein